MRSPVARWAFVLLLLAVGLAASGALLIDYTTAAPVFCAEGGGCEALRQTAMARPLGIPLPLAGLAGFFVLAMLALTRGRRVRYANLVVSGVGGVVGMVLLVAQLALHHLCPYCAAVDTSAVLLAWLAWDRARCGWDAPSGVLPSLVSAMGLAGAVAAPVLWARHEAAKLPAVIAAELAETPPGKVTIVDFVDFECPWCRQMQERLAPQILAQKERVHLVRKMVPLTRIHPHALDAARAACCAEALGKGDAMADALFETKVEDLTPDGCARVAESLGLPLDRYRACLASPETDARLAKDRREFDQAARKGDGLPLMWVGSHKMMGAQDEATLSRALVDALAGAGS
jgi:uncharacterized membrane protein/predicted DsbA family dithiol-disulfide isomerase